MATYRKGQNLFYVYTDEDTGLCELWVYIVRTIRAGFVYAVKYEKGITWVKLSSKKGHWGFAKTIDPIWRDKTPIGKNFVDLHTTKLKAWQAAFKDARATKDEYFEHGAKDKILKTCKSMITRNRRGKK